MDNDKFQEANDKSKTNGGNENNGLSFLSIMGSEKSVSNSAGTETHLQNLPMSILKPSVQLMTGSTGGAIVEGLALSARFEGASAAFGGRFTGAEAAISATVKGTAAAMNAGEAAATKHVTEAAAQALGEIAISTTIMAIKFATATKNELEQHRKDHPTASSYERSIAKTALGLIPGTVAGNLIEFGDVKARQTAKWVKGLIQ